MGHWGWENSIKKTFAYFLIWKKLMDCIYKGNSNFTDISWHEPENEDTNKLFRYKMIINIPINKCTGTN